jgi:transposase
MDGARIHCHRGIIDYLRSVGIIPLFLPAYCPFFNPIEVMFGLMKGHMKLFYQEGKITATTLPIQVGKVIRKFQKYELSSVFDHCGYAVASSFDPSRALKESVDIVN